MERRLLVWRKPNFKKGNRLTVPVPFYHSFLYQGAGNAQEKKREEESLAKVERKIASLQTS